MNIKDINIELVKEYENNPRHNENAVDKVAESIKEFGFKVPIIIDKNNVIVTGHTRLKAAKKLGFKKVPCLIADDLTPEQIKAFRLADNKVSEFATWDEDKLYSELLELKVVDFNIETFGFETKDIDTSNVNIDEIKDKFESENTKETETIEDDFEIELPEEPISKLGDIYQLGNHRLMCGDSTSEVDVKKLMNGKKTEMAFTSPPYNVGHNLGYEDKNSKYVDDNDDKNEKDYINFLKKFTQLTLNHSKYSFVNIQSLANNKISLIYYLYEMQKHYADTIIWDKGFGVPAMGENILNSAFEYIHIFNENGKKRIGTKRFRGNIPNVVHIGKQSKNEFSDIHNATFSVQFVSFFIMNFTNEEESIMDMFGGTGTTLIACEQLNRQCFMMELDPKYVDVIIKRWETLTGRKAVKLN